MDVAAGISLLQRLSGPAATPMDTRRTAIRMYGVPSQCRLHAGNAWAYRTLLRESIPPQAHPIHPDAKKTHTLRHRKLDKSNDPVDARSGKRADPGRS
jgi:hypothetical protein